MMDEKKDRDEQIKKLAEMVKEIDFAMLTTVEPDGTLRSRPMSTQKIEFDGDLWFFTNASTPKVDDIGHEQNVNVSYARPEEQQYVSVSGKAQLVRDRAKIEELWNPAYKAWFPEGLDDPDLALLKVVAEKAEYWDGNSSVVAHLVGLVKAVATGTAYHGGENEKLDLK
ncbi:MAG: pyridoxamine 5'-phosphate oxidase family protein [Rubrivivax sp.]|nr:pyridoxamine 5'-phosphate oxidase family protein [Pyrinomonadaceae bacterium]